MRLEKTKQFITNWLKEYAQQNQMKNLVIGVSGGIDSSLTSTLCAETDLKTIVISMPIHQKKNEIDNATTHMNWLKKHYKNIQCETIDLSNTFEMYKKVIPIKFHSELSLANTRARLRMMTLYQIAGQVKGLVVGTGNKIEDFGIGFFTKYGDGGVDISPIADLTKTQVRELAAALKIQEEILINDNILQYSWVLLPLLLVSIIQHLWSLKIKNDSFKMQIDIVNKISSGS